MLDAVATLPSGFDLRSASTAPTSHAQRRMWFFDRMLPGNAIYNMQCTEFLSGAFDEAALRQTLEAIVARHEALHTTFSEEGGIPVQVIRPSLPTAITLIDLTGRPAGSRSREAETVLRDELKSGFDLEHGPLVRFTVLLMQPGQQIVSMTAHHIVMDLWSFGVFGREFATLYAAFRAGRPSPLSTPLLRYAEYVAAQNERFASGSDDPQLVYWRERLRGVPVTSEFPTDRPRPAAQTFSGETRNITIPASVAQSLRDLARRCDATLFMALFASFLLLLHRHSGQGDLVVGTPIANRAKAGLADVIGLLVNTILLRVDLSDDPTVTEVLARVREATLGAMAHQDVPFEMLLEELRTERDPSRSPLFQTLFMFQPVGTAAADADGKSAPTNGAKFDISAIFTDTAPTIHCALEYNTDLFAPATIDAFGSHLVSLIASMVADPDCRVSRLEMLIPTERKLIVEGWNATDAPVPPGLCLHHMIEGAARRHPDAIAVVHAGTQLSYAELDRRADALARNLRSLGAGPEVCVGLCAARSIDWAVGIVGVLKAGAALVPLDPTFPPERLRFMIEDAKVAIVLTEVGPSAKLQGAGAKLLHLGAVAEAEDAAGAELLAVTPDTLAYVVYTSGSTGRPKGVMVEHGSVANFMHCMTAAWGLHPGARMLQFTALGFDIGLSEVFLALTSGASLHLASQTEMMPGQPLLDVLRRERITHVTLPPSALAAMSPEGLPDLRLAISGGEPCDPAIARRWVQTVPIVNAYGPTEATIYASIGLPDPVTGLFPIGRPIANMRVYVLDRHGKPVPPGVAGEIHIGGIGVARGYLGRPELTAERFVPDTVSGRPGRLYRTGDLGRFDASGTLHYLGRMDRQLKVRGYRIEPGEVESVLRQHPQVADAAVVGLGSGSEARLIAYVIPEGTAPLAIALRGFVAGLLPDYMAPAAYVMVECWPRTPNGKIDHAALPRPDVLARESAAVYAAPEDEIERKVAAIWRDCLNVKEVGVDDNFFDLGGHSLLLVKVHGRLREDLKAELSLVDLFRFPTVRLLAGALRTTAAGRQGAEVKALARADQRAAQQNAARLRLRRRPSGEQHA